jgi:hypothetical protein
VATPSLWMKESLKFLARTLPELTQ